MCLICIIYIYRFLKRFLFLHFYNNRLSPYIFTWYISHFITIYIRGFGVYYWISKCFLMCSFCLFYCISLGTGVACCSKSKYISHVSRVGTNCFLRIKFFNSLIKTFIQVHETCTESSSLLEYHTFIRIFIICILFSAFTWPTLNFISFISIYII